MQSSQKEGSQVPEAESHRDTLKAVFHFGKLIDVLRVDLIFLPKSYGSFCFHQRVLDCISMDVGTILNFTHCYIPCVWLCTEPLVGIQLFAE